MNGIKFRLAMPELRELREELADLIGQHSELQLKYRAMRDSLAVEFRRDQSGVIEFALFEGDSRITAWHKVPADFDE